MDSTLHTVVMAWLFAMGACVGSFLNVAIFRLPRRCMTVFRPKRSFCPTCGRQLTWHDNIPILGWVRLRGRCAGCRQPISPRYPLVELFTALVFLWLGWRHLGSEQLLSPEAWGLVGIHAAAASALIVCTGTDLDHRIIPDSVDLGGMALAPPLLFLVPRALGSAPVDLEGWSREALGVFDSPFAWWGIEAALRPLAWLEALPAADPGLHLRLGALVASLVGAVLGAGLLYSLGAPFNRLLGPGAMCLGDVKLAGFVGALVGPQGLGSMLLVALFSGSLVGVAQVLRTPGPGGLGARLRTSSIPFGPFLALGGAVALFFPDAVPSAIRWWVSP